MQSTHNKSRMCSLCHGKQFPAAPGEWFPSCDCPAAQAQLLCCMHFGIKEVSLDIQYVKTRSATLNSKNSRLEMRFQCNIWHSYKLHNNNKADVCYVWMIAYLVPTSITPRWAGPSVACNLLSFHPWEPTWKSWLMLWHNIISYLLSL